jgi:hypothetical protein
LRATSDCASWRQKIAERRWRQSLCAQAPVLVISHRLLRQPGRAMQPIGPLPAA